MAPRRTDYTYVYHWDRIWGALAVLLVVIGGVGYAGYRWLGPAAEPVVAQTVGSSPAVAQPIGRAEERGEEPAKSEPLPAAPLSGAAPSQTVEDAKDKDSGAGAPAGRAASDAAATVTREAPEVAAAVSAQSSDATAPAAGEPSESVPPATAEVSETTPPATTAASEPLPAPDLQSEASEAAPATRQGSQRPTQRPMFQLQDVSVVSPAVERFQLAKRVINNEPRGGIESIVPKADGAAAVYCFSDIVGMKDRVLYYHWLRNGKRVAKVRVGAWGKRWRSHSSKILNPTMKGDWRVELRKADNTLLASAEFVYR